MAVYENGKILPGTQRKPRPRKAVERVRRGRRVWKEIAARRVKLGKHVVL